MSETTIHKIDTDAIRQGLYGDALSDRTEKLGARLSVVGIATLITSVFDVRATSTSLIPLDFSNHQDTLVTFLAVINSAMLVGYCIRMTNDVLRTNNEWATIRKFIALEQINRAYREAREVDDEVMAGEVDENDGYQDWNEEWWEEYLAIKERAEGRIKAIEDELVDRRIPIAVRWVKIIVFSSFPILVGVAALAHTWRNIVDFLIAIATFS